MRRVLALILCVFFVSTASLASLIFVEENQKRKIQESLTPNIVFSTTQQQIDKQSIQGISEVLSIHSDGHATLLLTLDNQRNFKLPPKERKLQIKQLGPIILSEKTLRQLQTFFSSSRHWTLKSKSYVQKKGLKGPWVAELVLKIKNEQLRAYLSSTEKYFPEISAEGYEFLALLDDIRKKLYSDTINKDTPKESLPLA